jgi:hypothetical protein
MQDNSHQQLNKLTRILLCLHGYRQQQAAGYVISETVKNKNFTTNMAHLPPPKLWYLPNHRNALQAHMKRC